MDEQIVKTRLHDDLRSIRSAVVWKLEGLSEHDVRRPLTATGSNLLGLVKHLALWEARYLGEVFDRPYPEPLPSWQDFAANRDHLWTTAQESRSEIIDRYARAGVHADATIDALALDAPGRVPWWPRPEVTLFAILVHVLTETSRHAGHVDILREQIDGVVGTVAAHASSSDQDGEEWRLHRERIEAAARAAATRPPG